MLIQTPDAAAPESERLTEAGSGQGRTSDVRGVIDNATPDRLYGWAWDFGHPAHRVRVVLRIGGETLAEARADGARPDLAKAGIGDGCHAFELPLRPEWRDRLAELAVVAFGDDGREYPIAVRLPRQSTPASNAMQRTMEGVIAEQRDLRRELVALRERTGQQDGERQAEVPAIDALQTRVQHLELWLTRLDTRLAELTVLAPPPAAAGIDPWQAVLYALLACISTGALAAATLRWLG
ncbi:hypothetical protein E2C06_00295 [Dankookia rubra]|uniref:Uncharacterized protein n=1 Tax=Dankookia rubra TaxID=1442381 RepID=A0A4R5QNZ9_9PROT|nr:hypothetical protein [Dankookia rubra]TDH64421.1 hypothetical protein E2C06_00295 [Dankookia rubra]